MTHDHADPTRAGELHHLELNVSNLDKSFEFWDWLLHELGYELKNEFDEGYSWINGPTYLVLVQSDDSRHPFDGQTPGLNHVAFHAQSRDHIDTLTSTVRERNAATVLYEDRHPFAGGYYALYCESPEGIKVEVVGPE